MPLRQLCIIFYTFITTILLLLVLRGACQLNLMKKNHQVYFGEYIRRNPLESISRVCVRNALGSFCWDCSLLPCLNPEVQPDSPFCKFDLPEEKGYLVSNYSEGTVDPLHNMLTELQNEHPDIIPTPHFPAMSSFYGPFTPTTYQNEYSLLQSETTNFCVHQENLFRGFQELRSPILSNPHIPSVSYSDMEMSRELLFSMGFFSQNNRSSFHPLEEGKRLERMVEDMSKINVREISRVGVIYVEYGQTLQNEVLGMTAGSLRYTKFLESIGTEIDLASHDGFRGGLNAGTDGSSSIYYANEGYEVMFHVITMMPRDPKDERCVSRKRHVGNDHVHIVWCENHRDYDPSIIRSQFNDAHIVIYPLINGMYRIRIHKKDHVPEFGPLRDGMVISDEILGEVVLQTAISANEAVRSTQPSYKIPFAARKEYIKELSERHKQPQPIETMMSRMFSRDTEENITSKKVFHENLESLHPEYHLPPPIGFIKKQYIKEDQGTVEFSEPLSKPASPFHNIERLSFTL
eukprot:TRINITY_DN7931_c0_g1_i2.p1 TRINITY_DN7931_c0_g1~~TRINITY_DN7931_c0_g1_i2.p1  ORF type:complete len:519 (-),score=74.87 TRINITY_DN7931_c0_g1_i2:1-1557(-)